MLKRKLTALGILLWLFINSSALFAQTNRGVGVRVKGPNGQTTEVKLYDGSYALIIGESNYSNGWDPLAGVASDVIAVKKILEQGGFKVETGENLTRQQFDGRLRKFIDDYGYQPNNRLLIYYAGHGHTLKSGGDGRELGYVVPIDAPDPTKDETGFRKKAISMDTVQNYAKEIQAKHAIFIFDSCFSGKLVSREKITIPPIIEESVAFPVRQFITAGAANQPVPDESIFRRSFVRGLEGEADRNNDGYITGTELADYLKEKVTNYSNRAQTPQYGKINDVELDKGDFVFVSLKTQSVPVSNNSGQEENPKVEIDRNAGEREAWSQIKESTNRGDFALFVESFPNGIFAGQAKARLEQIWWDSIKSSSQKPDFNEFLRQFPTGQYAGAAKFAVKRLETASTPVSNPVTPNNAGAITVGMSVSNSLGMKLMGVSAGSFQMGDSQYGPIRTVTLSQGFYMGRTEVTQGEWKAIMGSLPTKCERGSLSGEFVEDNKPIICVSWDDAQEFIRKLNEKGEGLYRLPTEAEWEYAARAGTTGDYAGNLDSGWYSLNSEDTMHEVATKQPNAWGLYDMHGNVWEWVEDWYGDYPKGTVSNPSGAASGLYRVYRGGSWFHEAGIARAAFRGSDPPSYRDGYLGFRLVRN